MATVIRLKRGGRKKKPYYRIVVQDSRSRVKGKEIEVLGVYHPCARPEPFSRVNAHRALHWLRTGAQPSDTVRSVFSKLGLMAHLHHGTTPEEAMVEFSHGPEAVKGYTPPAPPKPAPAPVQEEAAETEAAPEEAASGETAPSEADNVQESES
mgnify:CR=1 FL=1